MHCVPVVSGRWRNVKRVLMHIPLDVCLGCQKVAQNYLPVFGRIVVGVCFFAASMCARAQPWTLESSVERAVAVAPEVRASAADVAMRAGALRQAGAWPNPTVELRVDDRLGQEDGRGGVALTEVVISQPLPFRRRARQQAGAEASLAGARENQRYQRLLLEQEVARRYAALQLAYAQRALTLRRRDLAETFGGADTRRRDPLVRYLSPIESHRLTILREQAYQDVAVAEREYLNAAVDFRSLLALPDATPIDVAPLVPAVAPPPLEVFESYLGSHPALLSTQRALDAARASVAVAESQRYADPELKLFRGQDFLNGARRDVSGVGVSVQVPLWNTNRGPVDKAQAEVLRADADHAALRRDVLRRLRQAHGALGLLIAQTERLRTNLLEPAGKVIDLTRRGFASGESNILALVDANNTYFEAQASYLEQLRDAELIAAELRVAAGIPVSPNIEVKP